MIVEHPPLPELEEDQGSLNINESLARLSRFLAKRHWLILLPFSCVTLAVITVLTLLPNRYTSTAKLLVVQQQVPQRYVVPNSTTDVTSALQAMKQEVLSRTQLLRMINDFGLYPKERNRLAPEELLSLMLRDIDLVPINENPQRDKDIDAFRISFTTENALLAQQVTNTLTSLFINEYLRAGTEHATNTTNFLHQQVEEKGKELQAQEERLRRLQTAARRRTPRAAARQSRNSDRLAGTVAKHYGEPEPRTAAACASAGTVRRDSQTSIHTRPRGSSRSRKSKPGPFAFPPSGRPERARPAGSH